MRIAELSRTSGVPVPTIKFYLREHLLPAGRSTAPNQAAYDARHLHRLRLIRTLREVGGLSIERVGRVIRAIDDPTLTQHDRFGVAATALDRGRSRDAEAAPAMRAARADIDAFLERRGWDVRPDAAGRDELAEALAALRALGRPARAEVLEPYADVADRIAGWEVAAIPPSEDRARAVERMVVGTVIFERVLTALRRLAHEHHSALRERESPAARAGAPEPGPTNEPAASVPEQRPERGLDPVLEGPADRRVR